jgi:hypothetical protein
MDTATALLLLLLLLLLLRTGAPSSHQKGGCCGTRTGYEKQRSAIAYSGDAHEGEPRALRYRCVVVVVVVAVGGVGTSVFS